ncbi:uncharacterized protein LOC116349706 isoform X2 [Contarinia nasturtii]|uniref:uncharacterized protein LOC116349706 isoform X2 n=1 Tax=Contarinia nasturtii TaxID=265458 RepID=UPI0012D442AE|nr:uncharacterized protein LOC116349706 isoform X2 [Contarinia nasturtii]
MDSSQITITPSRDSPKNILNLLNDECIQAILRKLTNVGDFLSAAETCTQFQENAKQCYPPEFKEFSIDNEYIKWKHPLSIKCAPSFLRIFGHLIQSLELKYNGVDQKEKENYTKVLKMIENHCGRSLIELVVNGIDISSTNFSKFHVLEKLNISCCSMIAMELPLKLKVLKLNYVKCEEKFEWHQNHAIHLEEAEFYNVDYLEDSTFIEFLKFNSQLQRLTINHCDHLTPSVFEEISNLVPDLIELNIGIRPIFGYHYNGLVTQLGELRQLKCLNFIAYNQSITSLINTLAWNNLPIEDLTINDARFELEDLLKLKQLKRLEFSRCTTISSDVFVKIVKNLPVLTKIQIKSNISPHELIKALEYGKHLIELKIFTFDMHIDLHTYESILMLIKGQLELTVYDGTIDVDDDILVKNILSLFNWIHCVI